jgi:hypothetical protein
MASNFKFRVLTGNDPKARYDAISPKDALTFYLLDTGIGYLGETLLFDATDDKDYVTDMLGEGYTGDDTTVASTKAIVDYVTRKVNNAAEALTHEFFTQVKSHTLTEDDLNNENISVPEGVQVGDVGLLFTADSDNEEGGEKYYFISLMNYLQTVHSFKSTASIELLTDENNEVTANLKIKAGEESLKIDEENGGVYIEKATVINDGDGTDEGGEAPSADKLVTEEALVNYVVQSVLPAVDEAIKQALADVVTAVIDDGVVVDDGSES